MNAPATVLIPSAKPALYARLAQAVAPRKTRTVTQWSDAYRMLSSKGSGEPGRYNSGRTPHLREIMDCLSAHSPVQRVTVMKPAQGGVTELALNWIGYVMNESPAPMLAVLPTLEVRSRWARQRLEPMLKETPELARIFDARRQRDGSNTEGLKDFPGGMLILGGANSPASLSSMPIRYVICDELDRFPWEIGREGDPLGLIDERTKAFMRRKVLLISTPTIKGESRIAQEYDASDQRQLHLPCPHCASFIVLNWKHGEEHLALEESTITGKVYYICPDCGSGIEEHSKTQMLNEHRWIPKYPTRRHRGYHWNGLIAPVGLGYTWREMLDQWRNAQDDSTKLKRFTNTSLGEVFEEDGDGLDSTILRARIVEPAWESTPDSIQLIVAGVDVQKDRLEASVYGVQFHEPEIKTQNGKKISLKRDEELWALDHLLLPGDTTQPEVWNDLDEALSDAGVQLAGIDAGYNTQMVNAFVEKRTWCVALKGVEGMARPIVEDELKRRQRLRRRRKRGVPQEPVGVDTAKATLYARLRKENPGPGYIHYPDTATFDEEFFAQLTAERLVKRVRKGRFVQEWVKERPRNEALDCGVYVLAMILLARTYGPRARPLTSVGSAAVPAHVEQAPRRQPPPPPEPREYSL